MLLREISAFACFPNQPRGAPDRQVKTFLFRRGIQTLDSVKCEYTSTLSVSSMTSLTPCLWGQWLHLHHFFVVNNYTYSTPCLCGHWLHLHRVWIVNNYADTMSVKSTSTVRWNGVHLVKDYPDTAWSREFAHRFFERNALFWEQKSESAFHSFFWANQNFALF